MKKWKGFLSLAIAVLIIAPLSIVNAAVISEVNINVTLPAVGTEVVRTLHPSEFGDYFTYSPAPTFSAPSGAKYTVVGEPMMSKTTMSVDGFEVFYGTVTANTTYHFELSINPADPEDTFADDVVIKINGSTTGVIKNTYFSAAGGMVYGSMKTPEAVVVPDDEEEETEVTHYKVSFDVGNFGVDAEDIEFEENEIVSEDKLYLGYNQEALLLIGFYTDAEYKNAFVFGKPITKDIKLYVRFESISKIEEVIKEKLDKANLSIKANVTEKEALEYYKKAIGGTTADDEAYYNLYTLVGTVPTDFGKDYEYLDSIHYVDPTTEGYLYVSYKYFGKTLMYPYELKVSYSDSDDHDSALEDKAKEITNKNFAITNYVDYKEFVKVEDEEEIKKILDEAIKGIDGISEYTLEKIQENVYKSYPNDPFSNVYREDALLKGNSVYAYLYSSLGTAYKVDIPAGTADNHTAYMNAIKDEVKAFFESKGYTNVYFDTDDTDGKLYVNYRTEEDDYIPIATLYMIKNKDQFLIAKNLFVSTIDYNNFMEYSYSYALSEINEDTDYKLTEYVKNSITIMRKSLEDDGYDYFDGYEINGYIPQGKTVTLTFVVGTENNNRKFKVLHKKADGTIEEFTGVVKDGQFSIVVTETSPFVVGLGEVVKAQNNNPQTFDPILTSVVMLLLSTIGIVGTTLYFKKN